MGQGTGEKVQWLRRLAVQTQETEFKYPAPETSQAWTDISIIPTTWETQTEGPLGHRGHQTNLYFSKRHCLRGIR